MPTPPTGIGALRAAIAPRAPLPRAAALPVAAPTKSPTPPPTTVGPQAQHDLKLLQMMQEARQRRATVPPPQQQAAAPAKSEGGWSGFAKGLGHMVAGIPQGVVTLAEHAGQTIEGVPRLLIDMARNRVPQQVQPDPGLSLDRKIMEGVQQYFPLLADVGQSGERTIGRVTHPQRYAEAWRKGQLAQNLVEDVSNAALVGGAASRVLGAASRPITLSADEAAAVTGAARPATAGAMTADNISIADLARNAGGPDTGSLSRVVPFPETRTVTLPGRGLAGVAERGGHPELAAALERAGNVTRSATHLGEQGANLPALPYTAAARAGGRAVELLTGQRPGALLRQGVEQVGAKGGALFPMTEEGRRFNQVKANIERSGVDAQRFAIIPASIARERGLTAEEGRAALFSVDQAVQPVVKMVREYGGQVGDASIDEIIRRSYEGVEPGLRPTPADVRAVIAFEDRALPPETLSAMDEVAKAQSSISGQRTEVLTDLPQGEGLNPEQLGTGQLSYVQGRERRKIEVGRNQTQRALGAETARAGHLTRIADATEALNAELPAPPRPDAGYEAGVQAGRASKAESLARRAHAGAQRDLRQALDAYTKLEGGKPEVVQRAGAEVDRLTQRAVELEGMVRQSERRVSATTGLSKASGQVEEGAPRTFEGMAPRTETAPARPVVGQGEAQAATKRPTVDVSKAEGVTKVRTRAKEIGAAEARTIYGEIEAMTEGDRPSLPPPRAEAGAEYDWFYQLDSGTQRMLQSEGWMRGRTQARRNPAGGVSRERATVVGPDVVAEAMSRASGRPMSVDEAMTAYVDAIQRYREAAGGRSPDVIARVAEEMGLRPDVAKAVMERSGKDFALSAEAYRGTIADAGDSALHELRTGYQALSKDERVSFNSTLDAMLADPEATSSDFADLLDSYLPGAGDPDGPLAALGDMADLKDVARFVSTGERAASLRAVGAVRGPAQQRQLGRLEGQAAGTRAQLQDVYGQQRQARRLLGTAERGAARDVAQASGNVERAGAIEEGAAARAELAGAEAQQAASQRPASLGPWRRYEGRTATGEVTTPPSAGERAMIAQGATRARANEATARVARLQRSMDRANGRVADLPNELSRRFQERLATDINAPAVTRVRNIVRQGGDVLGDVAHDQRTGPYLTGTLRRLAQKYGVYDEVLGSSLAARTALSPADRGAVLLDAVAQAGKTMDSVDHQALADSVASDQLIGDINEAVRSDRAAGLQANTPYRVLDLVEQSPWAPRMPDDLRSQITKVAEQYEKQRARHLSTVFDRYAEAAPARFRRLMQTGRRQVKALLDVAEEKNRAAPGEGDIYIQMAEATSTTLNEFVDQGVDPTHLIGGDEVAQSFTAGSGRRLNQRRLRAQAVAKTGLRPLDPHAVSRLEADQMAKIIHNRTSQYVVAQFGRRADEVPAIAEAMRQWEADHAEAMPAKVLARTTKEAGWVPAEGTGVEPQTMVVSQGIDRQLQASRLDQSKMWQALRTGNRKWKSWVLPLSPKWLTGNVIGNVIQAAVHAGVDPVTLARRLHDISSHEGGLAALWDRSGLPDWAPAELASHGLSYNEWKIMYGTAEEGPRTPVGRLIAKSYKLNEFVDNLTRSATMLEHLKRGVPSEAAMDVALRSLGDFTRMSSVERRVVREILPFYAWMRHQTLATLRLPIYSPTRAAWLLHLADIYTDPDMQNSLLELIGSSIPLGGGKYLDAGTVSPLATLPEVPFSPTAIGRNVTPLLQVPLAAATGIDLRRTGQQITRPAGTMRRGAYGQELPTPPLYRLATNPLHGLGELGYVATQAAPSPIRALRDLALGPNTRYGTGYEVTNKGRTVPAPDKSKLSTILRGAGLPTVRTIDVKGARQRAQQQTKRQRG